MAKRAEGEPQYIPCSTYRLQLNRFFTFSQAAAVVNYLDDLGISDCYTSPFLMAHPGSLHGYDVTDPTRLNPEIGTEAEFRQFAAQLQRRGMGLIVDVVPNHMCITHPSNRWWWDVLENGQSSRYAKFFDIDWNPPRSEMAHKVLLPFLADQYGRSLENQQLTLSYEAGGFFVEWQGARLPIAPRSWALFLNQVLQAARQQLGASHDHVLELESILTALSYLPVRAETNPEKLRERQREKEIVKRRVSELVERSQAIQTVLHKSLLEVNGRKGEPHSFDQLERLLADQPYRVSYWRVAADEINYRRFFDINELAAIRVEDPEVFSAVHALVFDLVRKGYISGARIDHADGLFDPQQYFEDVQAMVPLGGATQTPADSAPQRRFFLVAEKILVGNEELRPSWAIEGTTGYGFLNFLNGLFVDGSKKRTFLRLYRQFTGWSQTYVDLVYECKRLVLQVSMASELTALARRIDWISEQHRWSRDFTLDSLRDAVREVIACFPVYRTYIRDGSSQPDHQDQQHLRRAIEAAKRRNPAVSGSLFDFIQSVLYLQHPDRISDDEKAEWRLFVMRFQQLTGPIMAKGLEATAFYRYCPLLSLNEVGGAPDLFGVSPVLFHSKNAIRQHAWRNSLLATSTHDNKRSEDVRARINVLSEMPQEWYRAARSWQRLNQNKKVLVGGDPVPSANEEYYLYQTLLGAWPGATITNGQYREFVERIYSHMKKALREAKIHSSWVSPNGEYEQAFRDFLAAILDRDAGNLFLAEFLPFQARIARIGIFNSLSQTLLKIASPGIPDFYQGTEVWSFTLTDPDNRRPVDHEQPRSMLEHLRSLKAADPSGFINRLVQSPEDGLIKLYVTQAALQFRRNERELFTHASYLPLRAVGEKHRHIIAFARFSRKRAVVAIAGRFFAQLRSDICAPTGIQTWGDTAVALRKQIAAKSYREILTGKAVVTEQRDDEMVLPVWKAFSELPIALLTIEEPNDAA